MYCVLRRKTDAMLGSGVLSVTPESRSLQMKGGSRVSPCARSPPLISDGGHSTSELKGRVCSSEALYHDSVKEEETRLPYGSPGIFKNRTKV